ncbi:hypothetical protein, partial [Microbacterium testaceum]|uniref:hypothetical protein n=1 Tax=Microbacterium testaceum TaxID=2033 RepID=UPI001D1715BA
MPYDDFKAGIAKRLGVTDADASDESVFSALDKALASTGTPPIPAGAVVVDGTVLEDLKAKAELGVKAHEQQVADRRDGIVAKALSEGRITAQSKDSWRKQLDQDEEGITALLA